MNRLAFISLAFMICLALLTLAPAVDSGVAQAQFHQDPGDTCLGPDDPFCNSGSGDTGGGGGAAGGSFSCKECKVFERTINGHTFEFGRCVERQTPGSWSTECEMQPDGLCDEMGGACIIQQA